MHWPTLSMTRTLQPVLNVKRCENNSIFLPAKYKILVYRLSGILGQRNTRSRESGKVGNKLNKLDPFSFLQLSRTEFDRETLKPGFTIFSSAVVRSTTVGNPN